MLTIISLSQTRAARVMFFIQGWNLLLNDVIYLLFMPYYEEYVHII